MFAFMIFKDGSYIITSKYKEGSLTWTIDRKDIIEISKDADNNATRFFDGKIYTFPTYGCIRGIKKLNGVYNTMIDMLFKYSKDLKRSK